MRTIQLLRPHALRPHLSPRYQCLRRCESTATKTAQGTPVAPLTHQPAPGFFRRYRSALIWSTISLSLGLMVGNTALNTISPPPMPEAGTHEDSVLIADLHRRIDEEFKVKVMRGKCLGVAKQLKGEEAGWVEVIPSDVGRDKILAGRLVENLQGAKSLGVERIFWDREGERLVAVVWLGGALSGWPGVTHGGLLATVLTEKIALANALANNDSDTHSAAAAAVPQRLPGTGQHAKMLAPTTMPPEPAQLSLNYVKPTYANSFHVIRVSPSFSAPAAADRDGDGASHVPPPIQGFEWAASVETLDAKTCVKATARFAPSSRLERAETKAAAAVRRGYAEFREWLWPSRQRSSQSG